MACAHEQTRMEWPRQFCKDCDMRRTFQRPDSDDGEWGAWKRPSPPRKHKPTGRPRGRPKKAKGTHYSVRMVFMVTPAQAKAIHRHAYKAGMGHSRFCRDSVMRRIGQVLPRGADGRVPPLPEGDDDDE